MNAFEALSKALAHQQAGQYAQAEQLCRAVLAVDPRQPDAWHLLGLVSHATGRSDLGLEYLREALRLKPDFTDAHYNLGKVLQDTGHLDDAVRSYQRCLELRPDFAEAHYNLGNAFNAMKNPQAAADRFRAAIRIRAGYLKALNNLGKTLIDLDQHTEAAEILQQAVQLKPNYASGLCNLGSALRNLGHLDESVAACQKANTLEPGSCLASLGAALLDQGKFAEAEAAFRESISRQPENDEAYRNMAVVCLRQGNIAEAMQWNERALDVMPDSPETHLLRSMLWLRQGDFDRGWPEYEWRWRCKEFSARAPRRPPWDGSPVLSGTLLLHAEQGFGDTLQFIRYAPLVKDRAKTVILRCSKKLIPLLSTCRGIDQFLPDDAPLPAFGAEVPLMSLPRALKTTLQTIPAAVPYLSADAALVERWRSQLPTRGSKIGIVWQGNPKYKDDQSRSFPLAQLAPLAQIENVQLISLQKGYGTEQLAAVRDAFPVVELPPDFDEMGGAFLDTAAVMMNLDLVISPDTAIAHLAGALGVPVWLATSYMPEWRWLLDRADTPWYPTMRLFRQTKINHWPDVFERMAEELGLWAAQSQSSRSA
jgi:tetratricopeptide (TPR) repeat protein